MRLTRATFIIGVMASLTGAAAYASECDPATASSFGTYLGEVFCRGALLPEGNISSTCDEEAAAACKDAFIHTTKTKCPTADNQDLYDQLIAQCDVAAP